MNSTTPTNQGTSSSNSRPLCRYFASNICYKGDNCEFSHDQNGKPDMTCRYNLAGNCAYGTRCRYDHIRPQNLHSVIPKLSGGNTPSPVSLRPIIPATTKPNPWNINSLVNFHQNMAQELELINGEIQQPTSSSAANNLNAMKLADIPLCPYFEVGFCLDGDFCKFVHGLMCDMCNLNKLHPHSEQQRLIHHRECLAEHEKQMEAAFAEAQSADKQCGICMEQIVEKGLRFGILQNCTHCYCLECIRKWRRHNDEQIETKTVRSCPECRVHSDYVIPSKNWVEDKEEKDKLISHFKENTKKIQCKYVIKGDVDNCPFGNKCFYKHQMPDGTIVEGKSPSELRKAKRNKTNLFDFLLFSPLSDSDDTEDDDFSAIFDSILDDEF